MTEEFDLAEIRVIRARLLGYQARSNQVSEAIGEKRRLTPVETEHVRGLYTSLKNDLKAEAAEFRKRWDHLSRVESCFYEPAIRKAAIALSPATNSNPITSDWMSALFDVEHELSYCLHGLEKVATS